MGKVIIKSRFSPLFGPYELEKKEAKKYVKSLWLYLRGKPCNWQKRLDYINNKYIFGYKFTIDDIKGVE